MKQVSNLQFKSFESLATKQPKITETQTQQGARELAKEFFKLLTTELLKTVNFDGSSDLEEDFMRGQLGEIFAGHLAESARSILQDLEKAMREVQKS